MFHLSLLPTSLWCICLQKQWLQAMKNLTNSASLIFFQITNVQATEESSKKRTGKEKNSINYVCTKHSMIWVHFNKANDFREL